MKMRVKKLHDGSGREKEQEAREEGRREDTGRANVDTKGNTTIGGIVTPQAHWGARGRRRWLEISSLQGLREVRDATYLTF